MNKHTVVYGQTLIDIAIKIYGDVDVVFEIIAANDGISFDSPLVVGSELILPSSELLDKNTVDYLKIKQKTISTDIADTFMSESEWIVNYHGNKGFWNDLGKWDDSEVWYDEA